MRVGMWGVMALSLGACAPRSFHGTARVQEGAGGCAVSEDEISRTYHPFIAEYDRRTREEYFRALGELYASKGPECLKGYAAARYNGEGDSFGVEVFERLRKFDARLPAVLVDPGVVFHLADLETFLAGEGRSVTGDPWAARKAFASWLEARQGKKKLCRGLALEGDRLAASIKEGGMSTGFQRNHVKRMTAILNRNGNPDFIFPAAAFPVSNPTFPMRSLFLNHMRDSSGDMFLSTSELDDICAAVAGMSRNTSSPKVYLFRLELNPLDAWSFNETLRAPNEWKPTFEKDSFCTRKAGQDWVCRKNSAAVESFVYFKIESSEIVSVEEVNEPPQFETRQ